MKSHNNEINSDHKKLRCAPLFGSGYGKRYETKAVHRYLMGQLLNTKATRSGSNEDANQQEIEN